MTVIRNRWHTLLSGFACYVLKRHEWKRAVRKKEPFGFEGVQRCKSCPAIRTVTLRSTRSLDKKPAHAASYIEATSQWPPQAEP